MKKDAKRPPREVTVRVPGSTSNCGAGFDTLGLALQIYNEVTLARAPRGVLAPAAGGSRQALPMLREVIAAWQAHTGAELDFGLSFRIEGDVPVARGLGSSVTVSAGALAALNELTGAGLSKHDLVGLVASIEGHPDNAAPGVLGGFCVARSDPGSGAYLDAVRVSVPAALRFVVCSPSLRMLTKQSRGVLPAALPYFDAVKSINSAAYLAAAFATGDYAKLRHSVSDFMHEPYRLPRIPGGRQAIVAGVAAGALTGWLSGSGSSVLCVARAADVPAVGRAMARAFRAEQTDGEVFPLRADNAGLKITRRR
ncbi:MAG: homoserine kinase [Opitutae bacterium]|nr:homoserine kinase [Opitutae bacterium]